MSKILVDILFILSFLLACTYYTEKTKPGSVKPRVDAEKLKEIAAIRENLNKAFEEDAEKQTSGGKGVIVQPEWTHGANTKTGSTKVVITQKNLKESAAIREEIQSAVNTGKYVKGESEFNTSQADHYLGLKFRSKNVLSNMVGAEKDKFDADMVGEALEDHTDTNLPNIVESTALEDDIDIEKLKSLEMTSRRTREVLVVKEIVEDLSFELGEDVKAWKHLEYDGREYYIGLRDVDLLMVQKDAIKYEKGYLHNVGSPILCLETFNHWNVESEKQEGIIIVAIAEKLIWYQVHSNDVFWEWVIGIPINVLQHFKIGNSEYVALSSNQSSRSGFSSLSIYQFDLRSKEYWMTQKLQLASECKDIAFLDTGRDAVLTVVENNSALIFTFNPYSEEGAHIKFELKHTIQSEGIQSVSAFRMGGFSYLAVGGLSPQILHYSEGEFVPKTILGQNFGLVEMFLPVPARSYRDDMLLLVQHRVDFESHALVVLETLIWDGEVFETAPPAPCIVGNYTFSHGISCLLDVQRESGIKGSAVLRKNDDIFIIVPRDMAESGLFQIKTELFAKNSELIDLKEIFAFLKDWVNEHDELVNEALYILETDGILPFAESGDFYNYSTLRVPELYFNGEIGKIFLNEHEFTDEEMRVDLEDLVGEIERLDINLGNEDDIIRHRRELTYDTLDFDNMETEDLVFQLLNGEKSYLKNSNLISDKTVSFDALNVTDEIRLSSARSVRDTLTELNGDLEFEEINGIQWRDFLNDIVLRNRPFQIEKLYSSGEVIVEGNTNVYNINGLRFPDNFLWSSGPHSSVIEAEKNFLSTLTASAVDTGGLLNNVNPLDIISLSETESISGTTTFTQLEVMERMEVNGTVHGRGLQKFLPNPSLLDSNIIHSACTFHHLEVSGPIFISEAYNGINMDTMLNDIVYRDTIKAKSISIPSQKIFHSVEFQEGIELNNNILNAIALSSFVTKNSIQNLDISSISGNVYFNNLSVSGLYDTVNVTELMQNSVHADSKAILNAEVKFTDGCWANSIQIMDSVNGVNDFAALDQDLTFEEVEFERIIADSVATKCDIVGTGHLNNKNPHSSFENKNAMVFVDELILNNGLQAKMLNNINSDTFISFLKHVDDIPAMIWEGNIIVNNIHTDGDVQINKLNNQNFDDDIQMSTIWLNRPNYLQTKLEFEKPIIVKGDLFVAGYLNEHNFSSTLQDIVFKSEKPIIVNSVKHFLENVKVLENSQIESVNNIPFTEIATKQTVERFLGNVYINNALSVDNLDISNILNGQLMDSFGKSFRYDEKINMLVLFGDIAFEGNLSIENLYIEGKLNSIGNVNEFFENLVYKNNICMLKGRTTFKNDVYIEKGAYIRNLNGYNMMHLIKNVVFINHPDPVIISASVVFKEPVQVKDLTIKGSLSTTNLGNCNLRNWIQDTIRIDKSVDIDGSLNFAEGALNNNSLHAVYINEMDMEYVVPLHTSQNISVCTSFSNIHLVESIDSSSVNGIDLRAEMENTLMINGNTYISAPLIMDTCDVLSSFYVSSLANSLYNLNDIISIRKDLEINFPINFLKVKTVDVKTNSTITGIDFTQWYRNSLLTKSEQNIVTGNWSASSLHTTSASVGEYITNIDKQEQITGRQNDHLYQSLTELCDKSNQLVENAKNKVYFAKYLEKSFCIGENEDIKAVFSVKDNHQSYLIINIRCQSNILVWNPEDEEYILLDQIDSGMIDEILTIPAGDGTFYLVTNVRSPLEHCTRMGLNTWYFDHQQKMQYFKSFQYSDISIIHPSAKNTNTFLAISENMGKLLQLAIDSNEERIWDLPISGSESYRFLPYDADLGVALSNGHHILLFNQSPRQQVRRKRNSSIKMEENVESTKSPDFNETIILSSLEYLPGIERILLDLMKNLNIQLLESKLSRESVKREHIFTDFMSFIQEMGNKQILASEVFTGFHFDKIQFTNNPTIIFVARTVDKIWPAMKQIKDIQINFRNPELESNVCGQILKMLSIAMNDILQMGKDSLENYSKNNHVTDLTAITSRVQNLQNEISDLIHEIQVILQKSKQFENDQAMASELSMQFLPPNISTPNPLEEPFVGQAILEKNFLVANSPHLPERGKGEIISIKAGLSRNRRTLIATTEIKDQPIDKEMNAIKIFFDVVTGSLFQVVSAYKPACLCAFRIEEESFLAFVEDKETIRILVYKGIRGFVEFLTFKVHEPVFGLQFVSVPPKTNSLCVRNYLIVNSRTNIDFYDIVMAGHCSPKRNNSYCLVTES